MEQHTVSRIWWPLKSSLPLYQRLNQRYKFCYLKIHTKKPHQKSNPCSSRIQILNSYRKKQVEEVLSGILTVEQKENAWGEKQVTFEHSVLFPSFLIPTIPYAPGSSCYSTSPEKGTGTLTCTKKSPNKSKYTQRETPMCMNGCRWMLADPRAATTALEF